MHCDILTRIRDVENLPSLPPVALEIIRLTRDEDVAVDRLAGVIQNDPALCAQLLRLLNSPAMGLSCEVRSIPQAVALLGTRSVRTLALGFAYTSALAGSLGEGLDLEQFWRLSVTSAVAARRLALARHPERADEAFLAGLLSDIGRLALCHVAADAYRAIVETARQNCCCVAQIESHLLGVTHARIGGELLAAWGLPSDIATAVRAHHGEELALLEGVALELANLSYCAAAIAELFAGGEQALLAVQALCQERLQIDQQWLDQLLQQIEQQIQQTADLLRVRVGVLPSWADLAGRVRELHAAPATDQQTDQA